MGNWQTSNAQVWFAKLKNAIWDALGYLWDDLICHWDAVSDSDLWASENTGTWFTKN